jgi:hypothetical protein
MNKKGVREKEEKKSRNEKGKCQDNDEEQQKEE